MAYWTATLTVTLTLTLNLKKEKDNVFDLNVCLKRILKWMIFSGTFDSLACKIYLYVESWDYVEAYDVLWSVLKYGGVSCAGDRPAQKMSSDV